MARHATVESDDSARVFGIWGAFFALIALVALVVVPTDGVAFGLCLLYLGSIFSLFMGASSRPKGGNFDSDEPALWPASFLGRRRFIIHAYLMGMVLTVIMGIVTEQASTIRTAAVALGILLFVFSLDEIIFDTTRKYKREASVRRNRLHATEAANTDSSKYTKHITAVVMISLMAMQLVFVTIAEYGEFVAQLSRWFN